MAIGTYVERPRRSSMRSALKQCDSANSFVLYHEDAEAFR